MVCCCQPLPAHGSRPRRCTMCTDVGCSNGEPGRCSVCTPLRCAAAEAQVHAVCWPACTDAPAGLRQHHGCMRFVRPDLGVRVHAWACLQPPARAPPGIQQQECCIRTLEHVGCQCRRPPQHAAGRCLRLKAAGVDHVERQVCQVADPLSVVTRDVRARRVHDLQASGRRGGVTCVPGVSMTCRWGGGGGCAAGVHLPVLGPHAVRAAGWQQHLPAGSSPEHRASSPGG